jgi:hypothetical protein
VPLTALPCRLLRSVLFSPATPAGDDYEKMIKGDPGIEDIYKWTEDGQNTPMRGKTGTGDGVHILTGPIYVCGAEPGDVLQVGGG